jgi:hypothetical protein
MPVPKRRRWFSLSLRTVLIGMTVVSVGFAWFLHHRREKIAEKERLEREFSDSVGLHFSDTFFGWDLPPRRFSRTGGAGSPLGMVDQWDWLRPMSVPVLRQVGVNLFAPIPKGLPELARHVPSIHIGVEIAGYRSEQKFDEALALLLSENTQELGILGEADDLTPLSQAPQLKRLECTRLTAASFATVLDHPRLEQVSCEVRGDELASLPSGTSSSLQRLAIRFDWPYQSPETTGGQYAWTERCSRLREIRATACDSSFLEAVGRELGGVESLHLRGVDAASLDQLPSWNRLRRLVLQLNSFEDRQLRAIGSIPGGLESLEIDGDYVDDITHPFSPQALAVLKRFGNLRRLRLDCCYLTKEHIAVLAELTQLEELSLEYNPLDDAAIAPLHRLPRLRTIYLDDTEVSDGQFRNIRGDWMRPEVW